MHCGGCWYHIDETKDQLMWHSAIKSYVFSKHLLAYLVTAES